MNRWMGKLEKWGAGGEEDEYELVIGVYCSFGALIGLPLGL